MRSPNFLRLLTLRISDESLFGVASVAEFSFLAFDGWSKL